jgi:hypothetical protein
MSSTTSSLRKRFSTRRGKGSVEMAPVSTTEEEPTDNSNRESFRGGKSREQPPATITIPSSKNKKREIVDAPSPVSIDRTASTETVTTATPTDNDSLDEHEMQLLLKIEAAIGRRMSSINNNNSFYGDASVGGRGGSIMQDSFIRRLSLVSMGSASGSISGSVAKLSTAESATSSLDGKVDAEKTPGELMAAMDRLREKLQDTQVQLSTEKARRRTREKNLVKLAKELGKNRSKFEEQAETIEEVRCIVFMWGFLLLLHNRRRPSCLQVFTRLTAVLHAWFVSVFVSYFALCSTQLQDEVRDVQKKLALVQQELDFQVARNHTLKVQSLEDLARALAEADAVYKSTCDEHDRRIRELSQSHAKQCEDLCREVIQANQEGIRLARELNEVTEGTNYRSRSLGRPQQLLRRSKASPFARRCLMVVVMMLFMAVSIHQRWFPIRFSVVPSSSFLTRPDYVLLLLLLLSLRYWY